MPSLLDLFNSGGGAFGDSPMSRESDFALRSQPSGLQKVLGILGDSISIGAGGQGMYSQEMEKRKLADAYTLFQSDPMAGAAAMMRINPEIGQKALAQFQKNQLDQKEFGLKEQEAGDKHLAAGITAAGTGQDLASRIMRASMRAGDPKTWAAGKAAVMRMGLPLAVDIPDEMPTKPDGSPDTEAIDNILMAGMSTKDRAGVENIQTDNDLNERKAQADIAIKAGNLKVRGAQVAGNLQQAAGRTGVAAARVALPHGKSGGTGPAAKAAPPVVKPPMKPDHDGQVKLDRATNTVWKAVHGDWVKQ